MFLARPVRSSGPRMPPPTRACVSPPPSPDCAPTSSTRSRSARPADLIVIRNDRIIFEWYASGGGHGRNTSLMGTWSSVAKSLVGATSMAYAYDHCGLKDTDLVSTYIPSWANVGTGTYTATAPGNWPADPLWGSKHRYTRLGMLASHMSGLADNHHAAEIVDIKSCQSGNQPVARQWLP